MVITSLANEKVKYVQSLKRRRVRYRERRFCVEGIRLVEDAWRAGVVPAFVFYEPGLRASPSGEEVLSKLEAAGVPCYAAATHVLHALSDTAAPQGIVAVLPFPDMTAPSHSDLFLILDEVRDPGNLGAVLRVAAGAGVSQVWLTPGTSDPFNPKAVRAGMGAHFRVPLAWGSWDRIRSAVAGSQVWLADVQGERWYDEVDWRQPSTLIVGGEAHGASEQALRLAMGSVRIPLTGGVESLNLAVAAGVILFEAVRQRRWVSRTL
ncbi:MAG: RNA methyltransferase [Anaerolineae bacterium]|nr:RNA methyltransferase [Anaerolineae bacterium]MDW8098125.1 RNA methyltransferase [Anaerolineae bacterium]